MQHDKLILTHRKLTIIFTGLVFFVVCVLGFSTLGARYLNQLRIQKADFRKSSSEIERVLESGNIILQNFFLNQVQERRKLEDRLWENKDTPGKPFLSFFILDENNEIVFENIIESVDFWDAKIPEDAMIYRKWGILYQSISIDSQYGKKVVFYAKLRYDAEDLFEDSMILLVMILLFSVLVYFLGYRFVERALQPVEENIEDMKDFIHNAGHELKTPLAVMRGNLQIMQAEWKLDVQLIQQSILEVDHMNALIESLRELSELGKLSEKKRLKLSDSLHTVVQDLLCLAGKKDVEIQNHLWENFFVEANPHELHVLLSNIIKNAIKYNIQGGKVIISRSKNILTIADTGIGISREEQEKIFERFYQVKKIRSEEGFGIGLSLVKKIADANAWKISVQSERGKGTSFTIVF